LLIIGSLLLPLGCGDDTSGPDYATLLITTTSLPNAGAFVPYSETLVATGGDSTYTWSVTVGSLPMGLSLTASTGLISGTPSPLGIQTFTVQVTSGDGQTNARQLTITVEPPVLQPSELCTDYPHYAIATFEDANLEVEIRTALSAGDQERLTCARISGLTVLDADSAEITSLVGIQNITGLTRLELGNNSISDISALSRLTNLTRLYLEDNSISDISALSGLTSLTWLFLGNNSVSDISALGGLTSLETLSLYNNPNLTDIQPLLDNAGLGAADWVDLRFTSVSCMDVAALEAKGVTVTSDCP